MKKFIKFTLVAAMATVAASSFAAVRSSRQVIVTGGAPTNCVARPPGTNAPLALTNAAPIAAHLADTYAAVVPFDVNANGQLDATEQTALAAAIVDGTFVLPERTNAPAGTNCPVPPTPTADISTNIAAHLTAEYAVIAPFDANHDAALDATEQVALADAIVAGTVTFPMHLSRPEH
jgi:hypothetical protein